jgi:tetratricopeptide (TPR) repeat protein
MTFLLIAILIIICIIIITNNKKKPKLEKPKDVEVENPIDDILDDRTVLYSYLLMKLNTDFLRIEKQKEAIELQKKVKMAEQDFEQLQILKVEVENFHELTVIDLADSYFNTADEYAKKKSTYNMALVFYNKAIDLVKEPMYYNNRGCLYHKMNALLVAIDDYNKAIILNPNNGQYYYNRGWAYYTLSRKNDALRDLQIASKMGIVEAEKLLQFYF